MRKIIITIVIFFAIIAFLAYSPIVKWFLDDGSIDLCNGYYITQHNRLQIHLTYMKVDDIGNNILIDDFFITGYISSDPYIFVKGIHSQESTLSDEERSNGDIVYYYIDSLENNIVGPFESYEEFLKHCEAKAMKIFETWETTK